MYVSVYAWDVYFRNDSVYSIKLHIGIGNVFINFMNTLSAVR